MKSGIIKGLGMVLFILTFTINAVAAQINCSPWAKAYMEKAAQQEFMPEGLLEKADMVANRKEFCEIIMAFYEMETGDSYEVFGSSPFEDEDSEFVIGAVELGLFSGISETEFNPSGKVTREQMAAVMTRLADSLSLPLIQQQDSDERFKDDGDIESWAKESVYVLKKNNLISGDGDNYFLPQGETTIEQIIVVLLKIQEFAEDNVEAGEEEIQYLNPNPVTVGNISVSLGESVERVLNKFGAPSRIEDSIYGFERYIYNEDYRDFIMIGIDGGKVVEIYTNAASFAYGDITSQTEYYSLQFDRFEEYSTEKAEYRSTTYELKLFFDISEDKLVDAVYLITPGYSVQNSSYNEELEYIVEEELLDIINSARVKYGYDVLVRDEDADQVAKNHSMEMKSLLRSSYINAKGLDPFDRMNKAGIQYIVAAENISGEVSGDAIDVYAWWMSHVGTKANITEASFTNVGLGASAAAARSRFYITMDIYKCVE